MVNGNEASTWTLAALPATLRGRLDAEARQRRYRDAAAMLFAPPANLAAGAATESDF